MSLSLTSTLTTSDWKHISFSAIATLPLGSIFVIEGYPGLSSTRVYIKTDAGYYGYTLGTFAVDSKPVFDSVSSLYMLTEDSNRRFAIDVAHVDFRLDTPVYDNGYANSIDIVLVRKGWYENHDLIEEYIDNIQELKLAQTDISQYELDYVSERFENFMPGYTWYTLDVSVFDEYSGEIGILIEKATIINADYNYDDLRYTAGWRPVVYYAETNVFLSHVAVRYPTTISSINIDTSSQDWRIDPIVSEERTISFFCKSTYYVGYKKRESYIDPVEEYIGHIQELKLAQTDISQYEIENVSEKVKELMPDYTWYTADIPVFDAHSGELGIFIEKSRILNSYDFHSEKYYPIIYDSENNKFWEYSFFTDPTLIQRISTDTSSHNWSIDPIMTKGRVMHPMCRDYYCVGYKTKVDPVEEYISNIQELKLAQKDLGVIADYPEGSVLYAQTNGKESNLEEEWFIFISEEPAIIINFSSSESSKSLFKRKTGLPLDKMSDYISSQCTSIETTLSKHSSIYNYGSSLNSFKYYDQEIGSNIIKTTRVLKVARVGWDGEIDPVEEYIGHIQELKLSQAATRHTSILDVPVGSILDISDYQYPFVVLKKDSSYITFLQITFFKGNEVDAHREALECHDEDSLIAAFDEHSSNGTIEDYKVIFTIRGVLERWSYDFTVKRLGWGGEIDPVEEYVGHIQELKLSKKKDLIQVRDGMSVKVKDMHSIEPVGTIVGVVPDSNDILIYVEVTPKNADLDKRILIFPKNELESLGEEETHAE